MPRVRALDLPPVTELTPEQAEQIFGAGRYRPSFEQLEDRQMLSASAFSNLLNVPAQFNLRDDGHLLQTTAQAQTDLGTGVQGLYQGKDSAADQVAFELIGQSLKEFTPNQGWVTVGAADQAAQDSSGDVFYRQGSMLQQTTGVPTSGTTGSQVLQNAGVQTLVQGTNASGNSVAYALLRDGRLIQPGTTNVWGGPVQSLVQGSDGYGRSQAYALWGDGTLYQLGTWNVVARPGVVTCLVQGQNSSGGTLAYALQADGSVSRVNGNFLQPVSAAGAGSTSALAVGVDGYGVSRAYMLRTDGSVSALVDLSLQPVSGADMGSTTALVQGEDGYGSTLAYALQGDGSVSRVNGTFLQPVSAAGAGSASALAVGVDGYGVSRAYVLRTDHSVSALVDLGLQPVSGAGVGSTTTLVQGEDGYGSTLAYVLQDDGSVSRVNNTFLQPVSNSGTGSSMALVVGVDGYGVSRAYVLRTDGSVNALVDLSLQPVSGAGVGSTTALVRGEDGYGSTLAYVLQGDGSVRRVNGAFLQAVSGAGAGSTSELAVGLGGDGFARAYLLKTDQSVSALVDLGLQTIGTSGVASDGNIWFLGVAPVDSAGNHTIFRLSNGQVTQSTAYANRLYSASGTVWAIDASGQIQFWGDPSATDGAGGLTLMGSGLKTAWVNVRDIVTGSWRNGGGDPPNMGAPDQDPIEVIEEFTAAQLQSRWNTYSTTATDFVNSHGGNAWFCTKEFASWAGPTTIGVEVVAAYLTDGESLADAPGRLGSQLLTQLKEFGEWFAQKYGGPTMDANAILGELKTGQLELKTVEVDYIDGAHLGFGIVVAHPAPLTSSSSPADAIAIDTTGTPITISPVQGGGPAVVNTGPVQSPGVGVIALDIPPS